MAIPPKSKHKNNQQGVPTENILDLRTKKTKPNPRKTGWFGRQAQSARRTTVDLQPTSSAPRPHSIRELPITIRSTASPVSVPEEEMNFDDFVKPVETTGVKSSLQPGRQVKRHQTSSQQEAQEHAVHFRMLRPKQAVMGVAVFAILGLLTLIPSAISRLVDSVQVLQHDVVELAHTGFASFTVGAQAAEQQNFSQAVVEFETAASQFSTARERLHSLTNGLITFSRILPGKGSEPASVDSLLLIGQHLAEAGNAISQGAEILTTADIAALRQNQEIGLTSLLVVLHATLRQAQDHLAIATVAAQEVQIEALPSDVQAQVHTLFEALPTATASVDRFVQSVEVALGILGHDAPRRYLVLFQNNHELRATGGFLGSFAMIDINKGVVTKMSIPGGGIYDVAGQFVERIQSPTPLRLVNPYWNIQDANWWPDFPTSAEKIEWFWGKSGGPTVDGVITLTPTVVEDLLRVTGPIDLSETHGVIIDADNFYTTVQLKAEAKFDETNESKKILADLTPILFNKLFNLQGEDILAGLSALDDALTQKDILLYADDPILQRQIATAGWAGKMEETTGDYLMVVDTNIGGGKTDSIIDETISHHVSLDGKGNVIDTVQVTRHHRGIPGDVLTGVNNWDYMRLYVPEGSELISASGFSEPEAERVLQPAPNTPVDPDYQAVSGDVYREEQSGMRISKELSKTVFANWVETVPGQSTIVTVSYRLPFRFDVGGGLFRSTDQYTLLIQKQPGSFDPYVVHSMDLPDSMRMRSESPTGAASSAGFVLDHDQLLEVVLTER